MAGPRHLQLTDIAVDRRDSDGRPLRILDVPDLTLAPGTQLGIEGPSGAGKSTLLDVVAGLTPPTHGQVTWGDEVVSAHAQSRRDRWRRTVVGSIFQDFHLIPELSIEQNVLLPQQFSAFRIAPSIRARARDLIAHVGLADAGRRAHLLSRGEQQRVALARALLAGPHLILADEPTASLDADTGRAVADLLIAEARAIGATLIVVSHDPALLARMDGRIRLVAGRAVAPAAGRSAEGATP